MMIIKKTISEAGRNLHTIIITAREENGSIETREAEPYSFKVKGGRELFYCFDIAKNGIRSFVVSRIISVEETENLFVPRWEIEV